MWSRLSADTGLGSLHAGAGADAALGRDEDTGQWKTQESIYHPAPGPYLQIQP